MLSSYILCFIKFWHLLSNKFSVGCVYSALNNNRFTGPIPSSLGALKQLKWFDVAYNQLSGTLPVSTTSLDGLGLDTWPVIEH